VRILKGRDTLPTMSPSMDAQHDDDGNDVVGSPPPLFVARVTTPSLA
jgi:hypothetical protein